MEDEDILELTAEVELHQHKEMLELAGEFKVQDYEEILELTAELALKDVADTSKTDSEFQSSPSSELDEALTQVVSGPGVSRPTRDVIIVTPAGSAEDEDILDLTPELELDPSLRPSRRDEALTNQTQLQRQAQVTGSAKRAHEPTREEIIAAMRRFISDD